MEVVTRLPRPEEPAALERLLEAQRLLCASCLDEDDCRQAQKLLQELGASTDEGGFDYFPALLTLASLSCTGFEPAIEEDKAKAAGLYLQFLRHEKSSELDTDLLEDAATQLCNIVREEKSGFSDDDQTHLEEIANGAGAGANPQVRTWTRYASHDLVRQLREAKEDPKDREKRLAREAARDVWKKEEIVRQRGLTEVALARALELQLEGNDLCRQGQLPGNAKGDSLLTRALELYGAATCVLSECLDAGGSGIGLSMVPDEAKNVRCRRGTLQSNAAQVCLSRRDWKEAQRLAQAAIEDEPENFKSRFRCARAEIELRDFAAAANTVDDALTMSRGRKKSDYNEYDANVLELWKLADEVSKTLPDFKWSASKPVPKNQEDFEKRLLGHWEYPGGTYEIAITNFGALVYREEKTQIDLMRKSKLTWKGEIEMVPGMELLMNYEPGCDMIRTQFIPPPDCPEEHKWKGPTNFHSKRVAKKEEPPEESVEEPVPVAPPPAPAPQVAPPAPPPAPSVPDDAPRLLWLSGNDDLSGCYTLLPDTLQNDRAVYRREADGTAATSGEVFLWYRGGNWGVTKTLNSSTLANPFLARCGDNSGQSQHPVDCHMRRPRWHLRKGRGKEDLDSTISLSATCPATLGTAGYPEKEAAAPKASATAAEQVTSLEPPPPALEVSGREGAHDEVNGLYQLAQSSDSSTPAVYIHSDRRLSLFHIKGYWVLAPEVCAVPSAVARCPAPAGSRSPLGCGNWEFLCGLKAGENPVMTKSTRSYEKDPAVCLRAAATEARAAENRAAVHEASPNTAQTSLQWPAWVEDASVELSGSEVKAAVVVREGLGIALKSLWLDAGAEILKVGTGVASEGTLSLALPTAVDTEALPVAKLSEKTRTLKIRLSIRS